MIDDERLQELLSRASSLYNNGEYKGAIEAWKEAIGVDPQSQKAREGIRMATLLLGDVDAAPAAGPAAEAAATADGAEEASQMPAEEAEAQVDLGIAQVKQLIAERRFSEAIEGAQGLLPLAPDSTELLNLLEEAQHSFESTPFIEEHLTLARELLNQERFAEAETECKKVFTLDAGHPGGKALLKEIRDRIQESLKAAASQLGGMTVKLTMPQALAAGAKPKPPEAKPAPARASQPPARVEIPEVYAGPEPGDETALPAGAALEQPLAESGDQAKLQEEVAARETLEAAFADQAFSGGPAEESPFELNDLGVRGPGPAAPAAAAPSPTAAPEKETVVEAKTVRPPTSRVVPKTPVSPAIPAETPAPPTPSSPPAQAAVSPPPIVAGTAKKTQAAQTEHPVAPAPAVKPATLAGKAGAPAAPAAKGTAPAPTAPASQPAKPATVPVSEVKADDETAAWETELAQLNLKDKERGLLRGTGAKVTAAAVDQSEVDLMSLLDTAGIPGAPESAPEAPTAHPPSVPLAHSKESVKPPETAEAARPKRHIASAAPEEVPHSEPRPRAADRPRPVAPVAKRGSSVMKYLLLLILLAGGGGAAWFFYIQPRVLGGAGQPGQPVAPPAGSPGGAVDGSHGPIPTPIGGTSRQQTGSPPPNGGAPASALPAPANVAVAATIGAGAAGAAPSPATGLPGTAGSPKVGAGAPAGSPAQTGGAGVAATEHPTEPIKPPTPPPLPPEEAKRRITAYTADGRRLMGLGKWREARAKLQAVLALDPANIEVKDLVDKVQAKIDDEQQLQDEFDSVKRLYADKDYENALRKLYRLPRDRGLGDIDLYIRNAWYDWAVVLLKAGNSRDALQKLSECLTVDPDDASALKVQEVAEKYNSRAKDRVFYAFTDSLPLRGFDQK